ncbi:DUF6053 domain-containing protein [Lysobacter enzymogenes]|uniref:DUF6053 domain-containing protein n=1 Tax=Lysobacter enzymogenes TaxID=69 RepID=UPI003748145B
MGEASAPTLSFQRLANRPKSIGPEGPPPKLRNQPSQRGVCGRGFSPDALVPPHRQPTEKHRA